MSEKSCGVYFNPFHQTPVCGVGAEKAQTLSPEACIHPFPGHLAASSWTQGLLLRSL